MRVEQGLIFTGKGFMLGTVHVSSDRIVDITGGAPHVSTDTPLLRTRVGNLGGVIPQGLMDVVGSGPSNEDDFDALIGPSEEPSASRRNHDDPDEEVINAKGCYVIPGLIDLHFHGCRGYDLCDGTQEALDEIARYEARRGITTINPATMTYPEEKLTDILSMVSEYQDLPDGSSFVGVNMEGPYIAPTKVGAQNPSYVREADWEEFQRLQEKAQGRIRIVDVAPEQPHALDFIAQASRSVRVSVAHTSTDYETAKRAFDAGARQVTHLYNAMPGLHHREPGPIAAAVEHDEVMAEIIADGVHIHPAMVRLAFKLFGADRMILVSDTMRACGLADGEYDLGGQVVTVSGKHATIANGSLAGSVTDLLGCLQTAVHEMDIPLVDAVKAATCNPAKALGIQGECGAIQAGQRADLVILDSNLNLKTVILRGSVLVRS